MSVHFPGENKVTPSMVAQNIARTNPLPAAFLLMAGSFCLAYLCKHFLSLNSGVAAIWLADALTIAFLYRFPVRAWALLLSASFVGCVVAAIASGLEFFIAALYSLAGVVESLVAAALLRFFCADGDFFGSVWRWVRFLFFGAFLSTVAGAGVGAGVAATFRGLAFNDVFVSWYLADTIGISVFLPFIHLLSKQTRGALLSLGPLVRFLGVALVSLASIFLILQFFSYPFVFVALPLIWAASRLELSQTLLLVFSAVLIVLAVFINGDHWLPEEIHGIDRPLDFLPLYAGMIPAYVMAVASSVERKRSQRIIEVESSFRAAMGSSRIGMLLVSLDNRIIQSNPSFCRFIGYSDVELRGLNIREVIGTEERNLGQQSSASGEGYNGGNLLFDFELGYVQDAEWRFMRKNGEQVWGHWSCSLARGANNDPLYAVVQVEDIDWRKRSEAQLAKAEERWKFSLTVTGQVVYDWDLVTGKTFYSEWLNSGVGIDAEDLASRHDWLARVSTEDRDGLLRAQLAHISGEAREIDCQYRVRTDGGEYRWIHEIARVIESDDQGQPVRLIGLLRDITENKQMARSLEEEKEHLQVTLNAIADAVIATDRRRRITFMNPVAEQLTGWSLNEVKGRDIDRVLQLSSGREGKPVSSPVEECLHHVMPFISAEGSVLHNRSGNSYDVKCSASPLRTGSGHVLGAVLVFQDVTETRQLIRQLRYKAHHDNLTHLPNREAFKRDLLEAVASVRNNEIVHTLAYMDLDRFKVINDSAGHQAGDALLRNVARFLKGQLRETDSVARLGGDEFGILLRDCNKEQGRLRCEQLVRKIIALRFPWAGRVFDVGASVGLTEIRRDNNHVADLMSQADVACYSAKHAGRGVVMLYEADSSAAADQHREIHMASRIREALDENRMLLYAQPIASASDPSHISHYELLVRMVDSDGSLIAPGAFIPAAERYGLMLQIDNWVMNEFLRTKAQAAAASGLSFAMNLSAEAIGDGEFQKKLIALLDDAELPSERLGIEITETAMINQMESASEFVAALRDMGCKVALDDFGNGLSSFNYLKAFSIDYIKIDGSFVRQVDSNFVDLMIVESINQVAHRLNARTIAEFVEDAGTAERLQKIGVDLLQGFHIGRPSPLEDVLAAACERGVVKTDSSLRQTGEGGEENRRSEVELET
ncbi:EAL domain-containing protein [Microbulbifer hydrolyticus]|uniref:Diguanylate cyclase (GGDEF)-like protein/PAS domain S-box-containing protein n=1 Tax=Microbulbifer hydrolyticus TaxID=48074 RepID=A0A6P1TAL8_9GAMM|nr:EAL domain-containing protein [Microbulbifer hydrolyticus]MBB5212147.1 diguanylate cyclase (GGDEF)-like protein/PAS domain S-box-containing protein [Microbulbifer hydrolyticus]QHQ39818.1 EAL domain-containing protein [Microbulbifer hydrolyticus]